MDGERFLLKRSVGAVAVCAAMLLVLAIAAPARAASAAESFVQDVANQATRIIDDSSLSADAKRDALSKMIDANLDLDKIARFELGKYARTATDAQYATFKPLLKQYVINFYVNNLIQYKDLTLKVMGSVDRGGDKGTVVETQVSANGDKPEAVNWWLLPAGNGFKIFDAQFENIWIAQNLRSTLGSVMDENGGSVEAGIAALKKQVESAPPSQ